MVLASVLAVVLVAGVIVAVLLVGGGDSDDDKADPVESKSPSPTEPERITTDVMSVASHFAGLGNFGSAASCRSEALSPGVTEAVVCGFGKYEVRLSEYAEQTGLDAQRATVAAPTQAPDLSSTATTATGTFSQLIYRDTGEDAYPDGATQLYWDSSGALQSAMVLNPDQNPTSQRLRDWYNEIGAPVAAPPFEGIAPFTNVDLYLYSEKYEYAIDRQTCKADKAQAREYDLVEYVECDATDGFFFAAFELPENLGDYRGTLPDRDDEDYIFKYGDAYTRGDDNRTEGIYRVYVGCVDPCDTAETLYTWGYVDDVDTATMFELYSNTGDGDADKMRDQIGLGD